LTRSALLGFKSPLANLGPRENRAAERTLKAAGAVADKEIGTALNRGDVAKTDYEGVDGE
jgi:hypothetical protein